MPMVLSLQELVLMVLLRHTTSVGVWKVVQMLQLVTTTILPTLIMALVLFLTSVAFVVETT